MVSVAVRQEGSSEVMERMVPFWMAMKMLRRIWKFSSRMEVLRIKISQVVFSFIFTSQIKADF